MTKRYFLINYTCYLKNTGTYSGMITICSDTHPSYIDIKKSIVLPSGIELSKSIPLLINNIHEFKNEHDYINFCVWDDEIDEHLEQRYENMIHRLKKLLKSRYLHSDESLNRLFENESIINIIKEYINNIGDNNGDVDELTQLIFNNK